MPNDSRFGQWADPNFGINLRQPGGVMPSAGAPSSTSASSDESNRLQFPRRTSAFSEAPGADFDSGIGHAATNPWPDFDSGIGHAPSSQFRFAEGGVVEDTDTGNAEEPSSNPFDFISKALDYGRQKYNVARLFLKQGFQDVDKKAKRDLNNMFDPARNDVGGQMAEEQTMADPERQGDVAEFQNNMILQNTPSNETLKWGDMDVPGQKKDSIYLAEGGVIPDEEQDPDQDGDVHQPAQQGGQMNEQQAMAYLSGQDAVPPEVAAAFERQADPQGAMDPSSRKLAAIQAAGTPDKAFGLMQHYRQRFNALNAFARAALQGAGGRPPNPAAAADALNQAYANVPDGTHMQFTPMRGGMRVSVGKAGGQPRPMRHFAEGGAVDDEEQFPGQAPSDRIPAGYRMSDEEAAQNTNPGVSLGQFLSGASRREDLQDPEIGARAERVADTGKVIALPFAALLQKLQSTWQFDNMVDTRGAAATEDEAQRGNMTSGVAQPGGGAPVPDAQQAWISGLKPTTAEEVAPGPQSKSWPSPTVDKVVAEAAQNEPLLRAQYEFIDQAYPWAGQAQERNLAKQKATENYYKNNAGVQRSQIGADASRYRTDAQERWTTLKAQMDGAAKQLAEQMKNDRAFTAIAAKMQIAKEKNDMQSYLGMLREAGRLSATFINNKPGLVTNEEQRNALLDRALEHAHIDVRNGPPQSGGAPAQGGTPVTNTQPSQSDIAFLRAHPDRAAQFDRKFGAGASNRVLGQ